MTSPDNQIYREYYNIYCDFLAKVSTLLSNRYNYFGLLFGM